MTLKIVKFDEVALRQPTYDVETPLSDELLALVNSMTETMQAADGVGLATPQVNRSERIFVMHNPDTGIERVCINPTITKRWGKVTTAEEGCLSLPGVTVKVPRHKFIKLDYTDASGTRHTNKKFRGLDARIIQHEYDHLQGKLIVDYARNDQ